MRAGCRSPLENRWQTAGASDAGLAALVQREMPRLGRVVSTRKAPRVTAAAVMSLVAYGRARYLALAVTGVEGRVARDPHEHDDHNDLRQEHRDEPARASP